MGRGRFNLEILAYHVRLVGGFMEPRLTHGAGSKKKDFRPETVARVTATQHHRARLS